MSIPDVLTSLEYGEKLRSLCVSFQTLTGKQLISTDRDIVQALWHSSRVIVAHGTEADPLFFFGNHRALELWEMDWEQFWNMPSRLTAEPLERMERTRLLKAVAQKGYIDDYSGIRVSRSGRRFKVRDAVVWNITNDQGILLGQAATFESVEWI